MISEEDHRGKNERMCAKVKCKCYAETLPGEADDTDYTCIVSTAEFIKVGIGRIHC